MKIQNFCGKAALMTAASLAVSAMLPAAASAAESFYFNYGGTNSSGSSGNVRTFTGSDGTKVEVSAYNIAGSSLSTAYVAQYNYGLGVINNYENGSSPNHTLDNSGSFDLFVLQFDETVSVSQLGFTAWGDTDISWAVGTTSTPFSSTLSIGDVSTLNSLFGSSTASNGYSMSDGTYFSRSVNAAEASGNLFLIAASTDPNRDRYSDYVKLKKLYATVVTPPVPEPATWGLMLAGLGIVGYSMRRRKTAVSFA